MKNLAIRVTTFDIDFSLNFRERKQKPMTTGWYFCHEFIVSNWTSFINVHCYGSLTRATMQLTNFISFSSFSSPRGAINVNKTQFCASIDGINFCCANRCEPAYCSATFSLKTLIFFKHFLLSFRLFLLIWTCTL